MKFILDYYIYIRPSDYHKMSNSTKTLTPCYLLGSAAIND